MFAQFGIQLYPGIHSVYFITIRSQLGYMTTEDRKNQKKIQCWIASSTWEQIEELGYTSPTTAVTIAFEKLLKESQEDNAGSQEIPILKSRLEELEKHNETLKKELEISQETHRNYMMQMQTLINQKVIEAPGAKKPWWRFW
jgi:molecular chaperone GrpE (heat shock protein)